MTSVSVGVPVWNGADYLESCIASLLDQTRPPDEIVISDNASTDATAAIAAGIAAAEPTIRVIRHDANMGAAGNFNHLVEQTDSDLFAWLPHDDIWSPELLARLVAAHAAPGVSVAYGTPVYIDEDGRPDGAPIPAIWSDAHDAPTRLRELLADPVRSHLHVCNPVLGLTRRSVLDDTGLIRPFGGSDKVLIVELALRGRLVPVEAAFFRRRHAQSSVRANPDGRARRRWFAPDSSGPPMPISRLLAAFTGAVRSAPLTPGERRAAAGAVARWATRERRPRVIAGETREWLGYRAGRLRTSRRS